MPWGIFTAGTRRPLWGERSTQRNLSSPLLVWTIGQEKEPSEGVLLWLWLCSDAAMQGEKYECTPWKEGLASPTALSMLSLSACASWSAPISPIAQGYAIPHSQLYQLQVNVVAALCCFPCTVRLSGGYPFPLCKKQTRRTRQGLPRLVKGKSHTCLDWCRSGRWSLCWACCLCSGLYNILFRCL